MDRKVKRAVVAALLKAGRCDLARLVVCARDNMVIRVWEGLSNEGYDFITKLAKPKHVYRGMAGTEYAATVGKGKPILSDKRYSHSSEGTSFSDDPTDAESYANFGRDDPRKTGRSNYLIEAKQTATMYRDRDGYIKSHDPVDTITRVWEMYVVPHPDGVNGQAIAIRQIK